MPIKTAAAYIRVSTDDQLEYSPDSQIKKIKEYAVDLKEEEDILKQKILKMNY